MLARFKPNPELPRSKIILIAFEVEGIPFSKSQEVEESPLVGGDPVHFDSPT